MPSWADHHNLIKEIVRLERQVKKLKKEAKEISEALLDKEVT